MVFPYLRLGTGAAARRMPVPAALAGVHRAHQHEAAGQRQGTGGPGDGDLPVLQGLAQRLQRGFIKLRQLVQKQDARLTARKKPFGVGCFPKIYVSFTYPIPLPYGGGNIGVNTPVARVGEAVSSI